MLLAGGWGPHGGSGVGLSGLLSNIFLVADQDPISTRDMIRQLRKTSRYQTDVTDEAQERQAEVHSEARGTARLPGYSPVKFPLRSRNYGNCRSKVMPSAKKIAERKRSVKELMQAHLEGEKVGRA